MWKLRIKKMNQRLLHVCIDIPEVGPVAVGLKDTVEI